MIGGSIIDGYQPVFRRNSRSDEESLDWYKGYPWLYTKQMFTL